MRQWMTALIACVSIAISIAGTAIMLHHVRRSRRAAAAAAEAAREEAYDEATGDGDAAAPLLTLNAEVFPKVGADVMLSFRNSETKEETRRWAAALEARGFTVFASMNTLMGGFAWPASIQYQVRECRAFVVVASPSYGASLWTRRELVLADAVAKPIIPIWHSGPWPPPAAAIYLAETQQIPRDSRTTELGGYADVGTPLELVVDELVRALMEMGIQPHGVGPDT
jgi:hypothetical protein